MMNDRMRYTDGAGFVPFKHYTDIAQFVTAPVNLRSEDKMPTSQESGRSNQKVLQITFNNNIASV